MVLGSGATYKLNKLAPRTWNPVIVPLERPQTTKSPLSEAAMHSISCETSRMFPSLHRFSSWNRTNALSIDKIMRRFCRIPVTRGFVWTYGSRIELNFGNLSPIFSTHQFITGNPEQTVGTESTVQCFIFDRHQLKISPHFQVFKLIVIVYILISRFIETSQ